MQDGRRVDQTLVALNVSIDDLYRRDRAVFVALDKRANDNNLILNRSVFVVRLRIEKLNFILFDGDNRLLGGSSAQPHASNDACEQACPQKLHFH